MPLRHSASTVLPAAAHYLNNHLLLKVKALGSKRRRRFSTVLMTTIIVLVAMSVVIILGVLSEHFSRRVESEFHKKLRAQQGQAEILIDNRFADIRNVLDNLAADNTIRVTVMLGARSQLKQRLTQTYPSGSGAYYFVQKYGDESIFPQSYSGLSQELITSVFEKLPYEEIIRDGSKTRLLWLFITPIMNTEGRMGTAYALYDLVEDKELIESMHPAVEGDISLITGNSLLFLSSGEILTLPFDVGELPRSPESSGLVSIDNKFALSRISGYHNLYFQSSLEGLNAEKRKVALLTGLSSALVLVISTLIAVYIGRKMVRPLHEMTKKAIQISEGRKELRFDGDGSYWEFEQLSQAFNYMLGSLKDAEERSRYKELLENVDDAVYILDGQGKILDANAAAYTRLGYLAHEFFHLTLATIVPDADARKIIAQLSTTTHNPRPPKLILETDHRKKDGSHLPVEIHSRPIVYRGEHVILNVARDISRRIEVEKEKKQLESQLIHAQKMEAIGTLAGGVAHDFNNLLMGIQGRLSMIRLQSESDQPHYRHVDQIEKAVTSAANLTKQLLGFARKGKYEIRPTCINTLVEDSTRMFIRTRKEVNLALETQDDLWTANADRGQIEQVLINLYVNAWQAMSDGGDLIVKTENIQLNEAFCKPFEVDAGDYVVIGVTDTGMGMDPETRERIFEPFFTTKGVGKGTGLGLASAYGIISNHKGFIQVESEKGRGTTFRIYLPASLSEIVKDAAVPDAPVKGKGTILIVDDEEESIIAEEVMLKELGYSVMHARRGEEAIRLYRENMETLDLITLDMIMPEMSGKEIYSRLKELNSEIRVLLISGYSHNEHVDDIMALGCNGYLQKPFDIHLLSQKINDVMRCDAAKMSGDT